MSEIKSEDVLVKEALELATAEAEAKAASLVTRFGFMVYPIIFRDIEKKDFIVGFIREPNRITKLRYLDKSVNGAATAMAELYDAIIIKEESDPRLYSESSEHDYIYLGASQAANKIIKASIDLYKKKSTT